MRYILYDKCGNNVPKEMGSFPSLLLAQLAAAALIDYPGSLPLEVKREYYYNDNDDHFIVYEVEEKEAKVMKDETGILGYIVVPKDIDPSRCIQHDLYTYEQAVNAAKYYVHTHMNHNNEAAEVTIHAVYSKPVEVFTGILTYSNKKL